MKKIILTLLLLTFKLSLAQTGWFWQNPKPQGSTLNDVVCINASQIIAIGDGGAVLKSGDGGVNWNVKYIFPSSDKNTNKLISLFCFDETNFAILSSSGIYMTSYNIMKTSDGGATWNKYLIDSLLSQSRFEKIIFTDNNTGWAFNCTYYHPFTYRTTNGGVNWQRYSINDRQDLSNVFFINQNTGWIRLDLNNEYYRTTNGGNNWTLNTAPANFTLPYFINQYTGWILGGSFKTTNGGDTWNQMSTTIDVPKNYAFINENTGWCINLDGLCRTINSGATWTPVYTTGGAADIINNVSSFGSSLFFAVGKAGKIAKSTDGGNNFINISSSVANYNPISDVSFVNENTGFVVTWKGLHRTTDGGNSWQNRDTTANYPHIKFLDENTGFFASTNVFAKTTNGGLNWSAQHYPGYNFSIINAFDANLYYVYGFDGQHQFQILAKTSDGGANWNYGWFPPGFQNSMVFLNKDIGYATGTNGTFKTTDGGASWLPKTNQTFHKLFFINENTGWSYFNIGSTGKIYKTTDGGITWQIKYSNNLVLPTAIQFANSLTGWFTAYIDGEGLIMKTTDGGESWNINSSFETAELDAISFINANTGWAVGWNGAILKTTTGGTIGVQQINTSLPDKFYLEQNYPNPFNPNTNIEFSLPKNSFVLLKVFDLLGREVANLVNENLSAGSYKYDFNASALPSGIYFYKLETENFSETKKMVLVK